LDSEQNGNQKDQKDEVAEKSEEVGSYQAAFHQNQDVSGR
jgi:hypothetical protein